MREPDYWYPYDYDEFCLTKEEPEFRDWYKGNDDYSFIDRLFEKLEGKNG